LRRRIRFQHEQQSARDIDPHRHRQRGQCGICNPDTLTYHSIAPPWQFGCVRNWRLSPFPAQWTSLQSDLFSIACFSVIQNNGGPSTGLRPSR
jgi:hypothetical protein